MANQYLPGLVICILLLMGIAIALRHASKPSPSIIGHSRNFLYEDLYADFSSAKSTCGKDNVTVEGLEVVSFDKNRRGNRMVIGKRTRVSLSYGTREIEDINIYLEKIEKGQFTFAYAADWQFNAKPQRVIKKDKGRVRCACTDIVK